MTLLPPLTTDDFGAYFAAVHGREPFPWQIRLAQQVAETGWPSLLDLPTGTGKTAAIDVAVFALALSASSSERRAARRITFVVDRRTIVDQAFQRAETIRQALDSSTTPILQRVRERLLSLGGDTPLATALLRGAIGRDERWARTPSQPVVLVSTVDQVGSRLLFRGYGVSTYARAIHAGLLGNDVLYLLDEVHLSQPFKETLQAVSRRYGLWAQASVALPFAVVEMSATPGEQRETPFTLDRNDLDHPILAARLGASKPVRLVAAAPRGFIAEVVNSAATMATQPGATIAVIVNRVNSAREAYQVLCKRIGSHADVRLLTGRMRPFDRALAELELVPRVSSGRSRSAGDRALVVVSTQAMEAGADFDFDGLVSECASLDSLRQRFGRLDRLGALAGSAQGVIVARTDSFEDDAVYGDAIGKTFNWLEAAAKNHVIDFGITSLSVPSDAEALGLLSPRPHAPVLLPSHLDLWVQTSPEPDPDPEVSLWLHGPKRGTADVQIIWRADLTSDLLENGPDVAVSVVDALPPVSTEALSVPFVAAQRWLQGRSEAAVSDVEGTSDAEDDTATTREQTGRSPRPAVLWVGDDSRVIEAAQLRPGQTIIVPAAYGGVEDGNWCPQASASVVDRAEMAAVAAGRRPTLRLCDAITLPLLGSSAPIPQDREDRDTDDRTAVLVWLSHVPHQSEHSAEQLLAQFRHRSTRISVERRRGASGEYFVAFARPRPDVEQGSSFTGISVTLRDHSAHVAEVVDQFCDAAGLAEEIRRDVITAAQWHDAGKADSRFQQWLHGGSEFQMLVQVEPLAKSRTRLAGPMAVSRARERSGYPSGGRHELASVALMEAAGARLSGAASDWNLVRHLVASHHGRCRPFAPFADDPQAAAVELHVTVDGHSATTTAAHHMERFDSGVSDWFWQSIRRYGWWGAAYVESLLRLADHRVSEREQLKSRNND